MSYVVGSRYFLIIGEWLSITARVVAVGDLEIVFDQVKMMGSAGDWQSSAMARRYFIEPVSDQVIVRRGAVDFACEVAP